MSDSQIPERKRSMPETPAAITTLHGVLSEDQRKVQVTIELSNGTSAPDIELCLFDAEHQMISKAAILELFGPRMVFTLHIRSTAVKMPLELSAKISYLPEVVFAEEKVEIKA